MTSQNSNLQHQTLADTTPPKFPKKQGFFHVEGGVQAIVLTRQAQAVPISLGGLGRAKKDGMSSLAWESVNFRGRLTRASYFEYGARIPSEFSFSTRNSLDPCSQHLQILGPRLRAPAMLIENAVETATTIAMKVTIVAARVLQSRKDKN